MLFEIKSNLIFFLRNKWLLASEAKMVNLFDGVRVAAITKYEVSHTLLDTHISYYPY